jgi:hypothetical protein
MTIFNGILSQLGSIATSLVPQIVPGADKLIEAGKAISAAFTNIKGLNGGTAPPDAEEAHDALLAKVRAHADSTLGRLEGD